MDGEKALKKQYTVLLLAAPIGSGHVLAAQALRQELERRGDVRVVQGDIFSFFPAVLGRVFLKAYLFVLDFFPWLYALSYRWGDRKDGGGLWLRALVNGALARLGAGFLDKVRPDAVLATHATPVGIVSLYKQRHPEKRIFLGAVVTDFCIHRWWLNKGIDTYFVADERLRERLPEEAAVEAYGIPLRRQFMALDRQAGRAAYGWTESERVCLIMGGGEGLLPMEELLAAFQQLRLDSKLRLVFVTGRNAGLQERLRRQAARMTEHLQADIFGFREDMPQLLAAADVVVTKAGGLTSAEVLVAAENYVIYKPLPGQEEGNAAFLQRWCGAHVCREAQELARLVLTLKSSSGGYYGRPRAAEHICSYVLARLQREER